MAGHNLTPVATIPFPHRVDTLSKFKEWQQSINRPQSIASSGTYEKDGKAWGHFDLRVGRSYVLGDAESCDMARRSAIEAIAADVHFWLMRSGGSVAWRIDLEVSEYEAPVWLAFGPDGPEIDFVSDVRGHADNRFGMIVARIRFFASSALSDRGGPAILTAAAGDQGVMSHG